MARHRLVAATHHARRRLLRACQRNLFCHTLLLADDIYLQPSDVAAFQPWLPLECGSRTVVLAGAKPGANQTVLDFGGAVGLLYHPAGQSFIFHGLLLQGMAPAASGSAAGLEAEMVGAYLWCVNQFAMRERELAKLHY